MSWRSNLVALAGLLVLGAPAGAGERGLCERLFVPEGYALTCSVEGDPASPISEGHLCPKGAATYELLTHDARATRVKYRPPFATDWQDLDPESALDMIAERVWATRGRTFEAHRDGIPLMQCPTIAHLGGATLDNEENYLIKKLFAGGLGMVAISNQARI